MEARTFFNATQSPVKLPAPEPLMIPHIIVSNRRLYQVETREVVGIVGYYSYPSPLCFSLLISSFSYSCDDCRSLRNEFLSIRFSRQPRTVFKTVLFDCGKQHKGYG